MSADLDKAIDLLRRDDYTCVVCRGDAVFTSRLPGVRPLLGWLDEGVDLRGFAAADRVVGKGAALLYGRLGVSEVYAPVISKPAVSVLKACGIGVVFDELAPFIANRAGTGACPMEVATEGISDPVAGEAAIRRRIAELSGK